MLRFPSAKSGSPRTEPGCKFKELRVQGSVLQDGLRPMAYEKSNTRRYGSVGISVKDIDGANVEVKLSFQKGGKQEKRIEPIFHSQEIRDQAFQTR